MGRGVNLVRIDLAALAHNFCQVVRLVGPERLILAVVKADAYGHGAVPVALTLQGLGCHFFGVSNCEEARELRAAGIIRPILLLGGLLPEECEEVLKYNLTPAIFDLKVAAHLNQEAKKAGRGVRIHLKLDTGMGRLGVLPGALTPFLEELKGLGGLEVEGLMTHLSRAEEPDKSFIQEQLALLEKSLPEMNRVGLFPTLVHAANSAAIMDYPPALKSLVRPGLMLYGAAPAKKMEGKVPLRPVMSLTSRITFIKRVPQGTPIGYGGTFITPRKSLIASVPVGYAHGYSRLYSNCARALVRGRRVPLVGRVCMDWSMLDVTDLPRAEVGDEVVLLGEQAGQCIGSWELAELAHTIPYEVMCSLGPRSERVYLEAGEEGLA